MKLYELADEWNELADLAFSTVDPETGEMPADVVAEMQRIEADFDHKLSACCRIVKNLEATAKACDDEVRRLRDRSATLWNRSDSLKGYMKAVLESLGERKREVDGLFTVSIRNNPASVAILNLDLVPHEFDVVFDRKVKLSDIGAALKAGQEVPGAELVQGTHLRIS